MSITLVTILKDGTIYPPLRSKDLVVRLLKGQISLGKFDRNKYLSAVDSFLEEPENAIDLKADILAVISREMPGLFAKSEIIYIICPPGIASKAQWKPALAAKSDINFEGIAVLKA